MAFWLQSLAYSTSGSQPAAGLSRPARLQWDDRICELGLIDRLLGKLRGLDLAGSQGFVGLHLANPTYGKVGKGSD